MGAHRKFDHEKILALYAQGMTPTDIGRKAKMTTAGICNIVRAACDAGDARAARYRKRPKPIIGPKAPAEPVVAAPVPRKDAVIVHVTTLGRHGGLAQRLPVSLPRLSFLGDWRGRGAGEAAG